MIQTETFTSENHFSSKYLKRRDNTDGLGADGWTVQYYNPFSRKGSEGRYVLTT